MATARWNESFETELETLAAQTLLALAVTLQVAHQKKLNKSNPPPHDNPAPVGDFPKKRTGFLQANVAIDPPTIAQIRATKSVRVGYRKAAAYGLFLGVRGWKWLLDTYRDEESRLRNMAGNLVTVEPR